MNRRRGRRSGPRSSLYRPYAEQAVPNPVLVGPLFGLSWTHCGPIKLNLEVVSDLRSVPKSLSEVSNFHFWLSFSRLGGLLGSLGLHLGYLSLFLSIFYRFLDDFSLILVSKINENFDEISAIF